MANVNCWRKMSAADSAGLRVRRGASGAFASCHFSGQPEQRRLRHGRLRSPENKEVLPPPASQLRLCISPLQPLTLLCRILLRPPPIAKVWQSHHHLSGMPPRHYRTADWVVLERPSVCLMCLRQLENPAGSIRCRPPQHGSKMMLSDEKRERRSWWLFHLRPHLLLGRSGRCNTVSRWLMYLLHSQQHLLWEKRYAG